MGIMETEYMVKPVKGGYLLRHKKRLFGKDWREEWVVLYEDSTLAWYKEKGRGDPEGSVVVKEAPELLAVSQWTLRIPGRPDLPAGCQVVQLMAFGTRRGEKVHWLLAQSEEEVNDWMTAISNTLPPPPQPPDELAGQKPTDSNNPRLPSVPIQSSESFQQIYSPHLITPDSNHFHQTRCADQAIPSSPVNTETTCLLVQNNSELNTGLIIAPAVANWGHGLGWGWNDTPYSFSTFMHDFDRNLDLSSHVDSYNGCDDADFGMDCSGDFGF